MLYWLLAAAGLGLLPVTYQVFFKIHRSMNDMPCIIVARPI